MTYLIFLIAICVGIVAYIFDWKEKQKKEEITIEEYRTLNKKSLSTTIVLFAILAYSFIVKLIQQ